MRVCSVMQPTYFPWAGYFNLIAKSDFFIFLDDAQFQKNSWHNRNRLLVNQKVHWLTVPVRHKALGQSIKDTEVDLTQHWRTKHSKLLKNNYSRHPFSKEVLDICNLIEMDDSEYLAELNIKLISWLLKKLNINTQILLSSAMDVKGKRTTRLIDLIKQLPVDCYLSPKGSAAYLEEDSFNDRSDVNLIYQEYSPEPYLQYRHKIFESHLSIIDVVANIGFSETSQYILTIKK